MSNEELIASLGVEFDASDIADLKEYLAAVEEAQALEAEEGETLKSTKLVIAAGGGQIVANFQPGPYGRGYCPKTGGGVFYGKPPPSGLSGEHKLKVGHMTVKLYQGDSKIWSGKGLQKGVSGTWEIKF